MAIRMRRGLLSELDESKLLAGEWAVTIDPETNRQKVLMCFGAGIVKQMGTYNDFVDMIEEISEDILDEYKEELNTIKSAVESIASDVSADKDAVVLIQTNITDVLIPQIQGYVSDAETAKTGAETAKAGAEQAKTDAEGEVTKAAAEVTKAEGEVTKAKGHADDSASNATLSKSYAVGGTGTRAGEDADNAKYYYEQTKAISGGDFVPNAEKGVANGVATLDSNGKVPSTQLPDMTIPTASETVLGGIKVGDNLSIDSDGVLSADAQEILVDGTTITQDSTSKEISVADDIAEHKDKSIVSDEGIHDIRYVKDDEKLQVYVDDEWVDCGGSVTTSKIIATTPSDEFVGEDVVLSYADGTVVQTQTFDSSKTLTFEGLYPSVYKITCSDVTKNVQVLQLGETYNVELKYIVNGDTATPINDVQLWLKCAEIDKSYTTIAEVLADTSTLYLLMSDENAMKYLARSTGFASSICANEDAMTYLGQSAYFDTTVGNNETWTNAIVSSSYIEKVFYSIIPIMTDYDKPSGLVTTDVTSYELTSYNAWHLFAKMNTRPMNGSYIAYTFPEGISKKVFKFLFYTENYNNSYGNYMPDDVYIQASNDNFSTFDELFHIEQKNYPYVAISNPISGIISNHNKYKSFRVYWTNNNMNNRIVNFTLYGR